MILSHQFHMVCACVDVSSALVKEWEKTER